MSQVLAIQNVVAERQRGVATSLVPFFRALGGSIGVGALGGLFATGLSRRLGAGGGERRPHARARDTPRPAGRPWTPAAFRLAIERALLPVFGILGALAVFNVFVTARFPECAVGARRSRPRR